MPLYGETPHTGTEHYPLPDNQLQYIRNWLALNPPPGRLDGAMGTLIQVANLIHTGSGDPNGSVTASPPALYLNTAGGSTTTLYVKESGTDTNTGWVGK